MNLMSLDVPLFKLECRFFYVAKHYSGWDRLPYLMEINCVLVFLIDYLVLYLVQTILNYKITLNRSLLYANFIHIPKPPST